MRPIKMKPKAKILAPLFVVLLCIISTVTGFAIERMDDDRPIRFDELPGKATSLINTHFKDREISFIKSEGFLMFKSYDVFFVDGTKIDFDHTGKWEDIDCIKGEIPKGVLPKQIEEYVRLHHPSDFIVRASHDRRGYEIDLSNGLEIEFDTKYRVKSYDR